MEYEIFKDDLVNGGIRYNIISNSMYIYTSMNYWEGMNEEILEKKKRRMFTVKIFNRKNDSMCHNLMSGDHWE